MQAESKEAGRVTDTVTVTDRDTVSRYKRNNLPSWCCSHQSERCIRKKNIANEFILLNTSEKNGFNSSIYYRITELMRLEGTPGCHLVQPHSSRDA